MIPPSNNAAVLHGVHGALPPDLAAWVCAFEGNPKTVPPVVWRGWAGGLAVPDAAGHNAYFTLGVYRCGPRGRANCAGIAGVMLDDLSAAQLAALPIRPSWAVETSPGNYQAGYLFPTLETDLSRVEALQRALIVKGLCDPGADGPSTRYCRLPFGVNGKHSPAFPCRLVEWAPTLRNTVEEVAHGLGLVLDPPRSPSASTAAPEWAALPEEKRAEIMADLASALQFIPADERGTWIAVGIALAGLGDAGRDLWVQWSRTSAKWQEGDADRYDGFACSRTGWASIFKRAQGLGWVNPRRLDPVDVFGPVAPPLPMGAQPVPQGPMQAPGGPLVPVAGAGGAVDTLHALLAETPLDTARAYAHAKHPGGILKRWQGEFLRWRGGAWSPASDDDIRASLYAFIDSLHLSFFKPTQSKVSNVMDALKSATHLDSTTAPPCWLEGEPVAPAADLVACANGLLHLPTCVLHPATPRLFNFNALPVAYRSDDSTPTAWLAFLAQVWPNDPESIAVLQELFGYLLTPDTSQQKVFLIVGPKRSGKGTIARVLVAMLGAANVAGPTLASLAGQFGLEPLVGKLVAILSDARLSGRTDQQAVAENLLRISGEDQVGVERKNKTTLTLRLGVRVVMLTNEVPRIADASGAMASRFVILKMGESFYGREDPGLTSRLLSELPGVFRWAVEGWHRLHARGYFVPPKSSADSAQELADLGSPIASFVRDACTVGPTVEVDVDQLFLAWRTWCAQEGIDRPGSKSHFGRDLKAAVQGIRIRQPRSEGDRLRVYAGIGLRPGTGWHGQLCIAGKF